MEVPKSPDEKKSEEDEQTLAELNSARRRWQANSESVSANQDIKQIKLFLFAM